MADRQQVSFGSPSAWWVSALRRGYTMATLDEGEVK
jgi:hypothetical protein